MALQPLVKIDRNGSVGVVTMNRPEKFNALSLPLVSEMIKGLDDLGRNNQIRVILLKGEGKSFCAGGDLQSMQEVDHPLAAAQWVEAVAELTKKIFDLDKFVVAMVQGYAAGAGFSLALACDFIVMASDAAFVLSFTRVGLIPDLGLIRFLADRVPPALAKEWIASGKSINAQEALKYGLINRIANDDLEAETERFIQFILNGPPIANQYVKRFVNHIRDLPFAETLNKEIMAQAILLQTEDHREGLRAFFERREPVFKGR